MSRCQKDRQPPGNGNRSTKTTSGGTATAVVDDQDRLVSYGGTSYAYTNNGELSRTIVGTDTTRFTYDALGNLTAVALPDGTAIGYLIDAQNRRIGKTVNDTLVRAWLYQGQLTPVAELDGSGNVVSRFVYATGVNVPDYLVRNDSTYRLIRDHLGSVRVVVNVASGSIAQRMSYDEFGIEVENTNPDWQPFGYAGGLTDSQTGLIRFGARDYDPVAGRWTAKDPIGFAGDDFLLYAYADGDPVNMLDPTGLKSVGALLACVADVGFNFLIGAWPPTNAIKYGFEFLGVLPVGVSPVQALFGYEPLFSPPDLTQNLAAAASINAVIARHTLSIGSTSDRKAFDRMQKLETRGDYVDALSNTGRRAARHSKLLRAARIAGRISGAANAIDAAVNAYRCGTSCNSQGK